MIKRIVIDSNITNQSLDAALLPRKNSNFFENFRIIFHSKLTKSFTEQGLNIVKISSKYYPMSSSIYLGNDARPVTLDPIKVTSSDFYYRNIEYKDIEFCIRAGNGIRGISSLNYVDPICKLPSLNVLSQIKDFSLGNLYFVPENGIYDIELECEYPLKLVGYSKKIISHKRQISGLVLAGVYFHHDYIVDKYSDTIKNCVCSPDCLDEMEPSPGQSGYPTIFVCRICGKLYTCKCFETYLPLTPKFDGKQWTFECSRDMWATGILSSLSFMENICHLCTNTTPRYKYGAAMYYSAFLQSYLPYFHLYTRKFPDASKREAENLLRDEVGHSRIGEKWTSETKLYNIVQKILPLNEVIFHYRSEELQGLELDIWIPDLRLGIEYQGIQHYEPVEHWGGVAALKKRQEKDELKRTLCKTLSYNLLEVRYDVSLDEKTITTLLKPYL